MQTGAGPAAEAEALGGSRNRSRPLKRKTQESIFSRVLLARRTGLEPAASGVTGLQAFEVYMVISMC